MSWILNEPPRPSRPSPEPPPGEPGATAAPALPDLPPEPEAGVAPPEMASPSTAPAAPAARKRGPDFRLGNRRRGGWWRVLLRLGLAGLGGLVTAGAMAAGILYTSLAHDLPRLDTFDKMVARGVARFEAADGSLAGEQYGERRLAVRWTDLPRPLILAFLASEDERFFDHSGLDFRGILRAMVTNLFSGEAKEGASTITQQLVKNLVGADKTYRRKVKEAILARRLEDLYSKEQILTWYLNVIFLGHNSYGVQAAAQSYFRKNVWELSLAECAILAGVPQSPSRTNPFVDLKAAKERMRTHVLDNMVRLGWITRAESDAALKEDIKVYPLRDVWGEEVPGYAAPIRRGAPARWSAPGEDWLERGLVIQMAVEPVAQRQAEAAVAGALEALARKQGFPGPLAHFDDARRVDFLVRNAPHVDLALGHRMLARVTAVTPTAATLEAGLATRGALPLANASWAAPYTADPKAASNSFGGELKDLGAALAVGDVVLVEVVAPPEPPKPKPAKKPKKPKPGDKDAAKDASDDAEPAGPVVAPGPPPGPYFALVPVPLVEGALASTDLWSGGLEAMVGSYDYDRSEVNRTESVRQTASAIKPIVYGKAYDMGLPASQLFSTAEYIDLATNYRASRESDKAEITVWEGLAESDNPVSHRVLDWVLGHTSVADYADWGKRLGLPFPLTGLKTDVRGPDQTLMGLLRAFTTYARQGRPPDLTMVKKVVDREGRILERRFAPVDPHATASDALVALWDAALHPVAPVVSPTTSYIVARNLAEGVQSGTGSYARRLGREAAGKTGTLSHDVWFAGFTGQRAAVVWVGTDRQDDRTLGPSRANSKVFGANTAVPLWVAYMKGVDLVPKGEKRPGVADDVPPDVTTVAIDLASGLLSPPDQKGEAIPHRRGTEPTQMAAEPVETDFQ